MAPVPAGRRPPLVSLALASAAGLGAQVLLLRLFANIQWHHFAYMVVSLALLGYGTSGSLLSVGRGFFRGRLRAAYLACLALFALGLVPAFLLAQGLAFSPEELLWRPVVAWRLAAIYLLLALPFLFVGAATGLAFMGWGSASGRVYAADLAGAAAGAAGVTGLLWILSPIHALAAVSLLAAVAVPVGARETGRGGLRAMTAVPVVAILLVGLEAAGWLVLEPSPYKDLSQALAVAGARVEARRSGPHGVVTVVANEVVPARRAPGLGIAARTTIPPQRTVFVDGDEAAVITAANDGTGEPGFLADLPSALPYYLSDPGRVLVLEAGGGLLVLQALRLGAHSITAVESNAEIVGLMRGPYRVFSGALYARPGVEVRETHPRAFLGSATGSWDLIQLPPPGSLASGAGGLFALGEDYLRTREAIALMLDRLAPDGVLAVHAWLGLPPRDSLRLVATVADVLAEREPGGFADRVLALRSWQLATVLVRNGRFTDRDVERMLEFASGRGFDPVWYAGMPREQANRVNRLAEPWLYDAMAAFAAGRGEAFFEDYKFNVRPVDDDAPFFHDFLSPGTLPEILPLLKTGGMALLEAGLVLLLAALVQAVMLGGLLILLPLAAGDSRTALAGSGLTRRVALYYAVIGFAFMFIELTALHRFALYLERPVYAAAVVLAAFLAFAGAGSALAGRIAMSARGPAFSARAGLAGILVTGAVWLLLLQPLLALTMAWPMPAKLALALAAIAPLAFAMGQMFPAGLHALTREAPDLVPWAWAVNGCASVVGAVLATVLAIAWGYALTLLAALFLYALTLPAFPSQASSSAASS